MIWAWRIFFNALFIVLSALFIAPLPAANVSGKVELRDSKEAAVRKKMDFSGVVIWLEPSNSGAAQSKSAWSAGTPAHARMVQKDKTFTPHVLAIPVGSTVDFPNFDPIFHNVFSNYDGQLFDLGLYPPGKSKSVMFTTAGIVRVFCNIHASMSAVIAVLDTRYFDTTKKDGSFVIQNVAEGDYRLRVFHERATPATLDALTRKITVTESENAPLPPISISESGYLTIPHLNKFGHDYPAPPEDGVYPAVRK